jgi:deoxyribodipyrimidine photo-lyase
MDKTKINLFWFRRDLRLQDNSALFESLNGKYPVMLIFIIDTNIINKLKDKSDPRMTFIYDQLKNIDTELRTRSSGLLVERGDPAEVFRKLLQTYNILGVYTNRDYEPYAIRRDQQVEKLLSDHKVQFHTFKDQVIFEPDEILKNDGNPYTVFTPYKNRWLDTLLDSWLLQKPGEKHLDHLYHSPVMQLPELSDIGFHRSTLDFPPKSIRMDVIRNYHKTRDFPGIEGTSRLGVHLRFGTISIRELVRQTKDVNETFLSELIWREFFMMILYHFPETLNHSFRQAYDRIPWRSSEHDFQKWCEGNTGFPIVDAGMRELNTTGYMHNRVRMITANFLTKLLLLDWRKGEQYFAEKLLDYEQSSNVGNWQWAAGSGCDAAPYFRIFNPETQIRKFDPDLKYIKKWIPEYNTNKYPKPMIDYKYARERALSVYRQVLKSF